MTGTTKLKKQAFLVAIAKSMGFDLAMEGFWHEAAPEYPIDNLNDVAEYCDVGDVHPVNLGIFFGATVYTVCRWSDGCNGDEGGELEYGHFDTFEEAESWASVKRIMEEAQ